MEFGIHLLDLVRVLTQDEIHSVSAEIDRAAFQQPEYRATLKLITRRGLPCYLDISRVSQGRVTRAEIIGAEGQALADWTTGIVRRISQGNETIDYPCPPRATLVDLLRDFCQAIRTGSPMPITAEDGLRAVRNCRCVLSIGTKRKTRFSRLIPEFHYLLSANCDCHCS